MHLFEFYDQPWFPGYLRDYVTEALQSVLVIGLPDLQGAEFPETGMCLISQHLSANCTVLNRHRWPVPIWL